MTNSFHRALTGKAAQQQVSAFQKKYQKDPEASQDLPFPLEARRTRRAEKAADRREAKKGRRAFVRTERAKEQAASDLANLFALDAQGNVRAREAIQTRIDFLLVEQVRKDENTDLTEQQIEAHLREIAKAAR